MARIIGEPNLDSDAPVYVTPSPGPGEPNGIEDAGGFNSSLRKIADLAPASPITPEGTIDPAWLGAASGNPQAVVAQILRAQYEGWKKSFMPIELRALNEVSLNNPEIEARAVNEAERTAIAGADMTKGILGRQTAALGIEATPQQKLVTDRILNLNRATDIAGARNAARANIRSQDEQILMGTAPNPNVVRSGG